MFRATVLPGGLAAYADQPHKGSKLHSWSSFIGIVTAIIGNVLISLALNIQRYAHIRLNRERNKFVEGQKHQTTRGHKETEYGTYQDLEDEGHFVHVNMSGQTAEATSLYGQRTEGEPDNVHSANETDALIAWRQPRALSDEWRPRRKSTTILPSAEVQKTYLSSRFWWAGIILMTIGEAGNFIAYGFAPASIVSPLGVVALISNCVIAPIMLKERFRRQDLFGVLVAVAGAVTVVLSAKTSERKLGPHQIWHAITRWEFEVYLGITGGLILAGLWASRRYGERTILIDLGLVGLFGRIQGDSALGVSHG